MATASSKGTASMYGDRSSLEWLLIAAVLILLYLLLASLSGWWPWEGSSGLRLGTAFDSNNSVDVDEDNSSDGESDDDSSGSGSGDTDNDDDGSGEDSDSDSDSDDSSSASRLVEFAVTLDRGDSKEEVEGEVGDLEENCAVVVNSSDLGKQEVCVYTEGEKIVTVTYLDDQVISASRSGF